MLSNGEIRDEVRNADFDWHYGWTLDDVEQNRFVTFARAIEAAVLAKLQAQSEPVAWLHSETNQAFTTEPPSGLKALCTPLFAHPAPVQQEPLWPVDGLYPDMTPPASSRDRWMYDQGRLVERRQNAVLKEEAMSWKICNDRTSAAAQDLDNLLKDNKAQNQTLLEALKKADQFITNGIELGFIRMPDKDTPDPAHQTQGIVRAAIAAVEGKQ